MYVVFLYPPSNTMASSIVYRCWPAENNNARAKTMLSPLDNYPIYATTREGLVKHLMQFLTDGDIYEEGNLDEELEKERTRLRKAIEKGLDSLGKSYEGRNGVMTVNRTVVSVPDLTHFPETLNLYMEIAELH
jgi:hypothetical protein